MRFRFTDKKLEQLYTGQQILIPAYVPPPADAIKMELEARAWSIHDFAQHSQLSEKELDDILAAKQALDALSAKKIARAFGSSSQLWLGLEENYQAYRQRQQGVRPKSG